MVEESSRNGVEWKKPKRSTTRRVCNHLFLKYFRREIWNWWWRFPPRGELNSWVFQLSLTAWRTTSKLGGIKPHPFFCAHWSCGSGIWPGPRVGWPISAHPCLGLHCEALIGSMWSGAGSTWRLLHSAAWHQGCGDSAFTRVPTAVFPRDWVFLTAGPPQSSQISYVATQGSKSKCSDSKAGTSGLYDQPPNSHALTLAVLRWLKRTSLLTLKEKL